MSFNPELRAGDADRDRVISVLTDSYAEGRLTNDEFQIRVDSVHAARTLGELSALIVDLPDAKAEVDVAQTNTVSLRKRRKDLRAGWTSWLGVGILVNVIWVATLMTQEGSAPYYWPIWVMGPWGAGMLIATISKPRDETSS